MLFGSLRANSSKNLKMEFAIHICRRKPNASGDYRRVLFSCYFQLSQLHTTVIYEIVKYLYSLYVCV